MDEQRQGGTNCDCCGSLMREYHDGYFCFDCYVFDVAHMPKREQKRHFEFVRRNDGLAVFEMLAEAVSKIEVVQAPSVHVVERVIAGLIGLSMFVIAR